MNKSIKTIVSDRQIPPISTHPTCAPLPAQLQPQPALTFAKSFEKYEVIIKNQLIEKELKCIQWRSKTEFPIAKVLFYKLLHTKIINQCFVVQIGLQNFTSTLHTLPLLPFYQLLYLLKESMIGFERLFDRFGNFEPNDRMVLINRAGRCKVWFNENITQNHPSKKVRMTESEFKYKVVSLFEEKYIPSTLSRQLFQKLNRAQKLIESISLIQQFSMSKKLVPPIKLTAIFESLGAKRGSNDNTLQDLALTKTSPQKMPLFIANIRQRATLKTRKYTDCQIKPIQIKRTVSTKNLTRHTPKSSYVTQNPQSTFERMFSDQRKTINKSLQSPPTKRNFKQLKNCLSAFLDSVTPRTPESYQSKTTASKYQKQASYFEKQEKVFRMKKDKHHVAKFRKFSQNVEEPKIRTFVHGKPMEKSESPVKQEIYTVKVSAQLTPKQLTFPFCRKNQNNIKQEIEKTPQYNLLKRYGAAPNEEDLISKNGWLKRINSLTVETFRDTVFSYSDGKDTLADHLTLPHIELDFLKTMGKELRGSVLLSSE